MQNVSETIRTVLAERRSTRAFLGRKVPPALLERILEAASLAPSGNNTQPWTLDVATGAARARLLDAIAKQQSAASPPAELEYPYYPEIWPEPFLSRRRALGWELYDLIGVQRGEREGALAHHNLNLRFFDAPVCLIVSVDRRLGAAAYIDVGCFMQSLALAAVSEGLATCLQAAIAPYHAAVRQALNIDPVQKIICGIALGYADAGAQINALRSEREAVSTFARFHHD